MKIQRLETSSRWPIPKLLLPEKPKAIAPATGQREDDEAGACRMAKKSCPIAPTPDDECEKRQRAAEAKSEVLNNVIQK